jgi:cyanophycinase
MTLPKGKLIAIGGNEDKGTESEPNFQQKNNLNFFELQILTRIVHETRGQKNAHIEVITSASSIPVEVGENYVQAFTKIGCTNIHVMHIRNREDTLNKDYIDRIKRCDGVMMTGGNQLRLSTIFGGTEILNILHRRYYEEDFVVAGTSAGAMAMSNTMIYEGNATNAHLKGEVRITTGLGFINGVIIDSHFNKRGRFPRLAQAVAANPGAIGIGLGEDTGVIVRNGEDLEAIGSGAVIIIDGRNVGSNNIADIEFGEAICVENLMVHIMCKGNTYNIKTRKFEEVAEKV